MGEIADAYDGKCVDRGFSTMRLALGYKRGLPESWVSQTISIRKFLNLLPSVFPGRRFRIWGDPKLCKGSFLWEHYIGTEYSTTAESNNWLTAFVYGPQEGKSHFVIGEPTVFGDMEVSLIIAVAIAPNL
jgi:hypothetical protein